MLGIVTHAIQYEISTKNESTIVIYLSAGNIFSLEWVKPADTYIMLHPSSAKVIYHFPFMIENFWSIFLSIFHRYTENYESVTWYQ